MSIDATTYSDYHLFSPLCRCVRVVKEMDLKPIVISRAGSNPVADACLSFAIAR